MKKCLIFAAVVAMFAMVFLACGKDEGGNGDASPPEVQLVYNTKDGLREDATANVKAIIVTWTGAAGYDYDVYFEQRDLNGVISPLEVSGVRGQTLYALKIKKDKTTGIPQTPFWEIDDNIDAAEETLWSIAISTEAGANHYYFGASSTTPTDTDNALDAVIASLTGEIDPTLPKTSTMSRSIYYRVGVAAANPGGYPIAEKRTVVYSEWF